MSKTQNEIIDDIITHIQKCGGNFSDWYVGITNDAKQRLFHEHKVREKKDAWIHRRAVSSEVARTIEQHLLDEFKMEGGAGGGSEDSSIVYAYKKKSHTEP